MLMALACTVDAHVFYAKRESPPFANGVEVTPYVHMRQSRQMRIHHWTCC